MVLSFTYKSCPSSSVLFPSINLREISYSQLRMLMKNYFFNAYNQISVWKYRWFLYLRLFCKYLEGRLFNLSFNLYCKNHRKCIGVYKITKNAFSNSITRKYLIFFFFFKKYYFNLFFISNCKYTHYSPALIWNCFTL